MVPMVPMAPTCVSLMLDTVWGGGRRVAAREWVEDEGGEGSKDIAVATQIRFTMVPACVILAGPCWCPCWWPALWPALLVGDEILAVTVDMEGMTGEREGRNPVVVMDVGEGDIRHRGMVKEERGGEYEEHKRIKERRNEKRAGVGRVRSVVSANFKWWGE